MRNPMRRIILLISLIAFALSASAVPETLQRADSAYAREDYRLAAQLYAKTLEESGPSPTVFYNLGNTNYRLNKIGKAILNYERALKLDPSFEEARTNLEFVNSKITDKPEDDSSFLGNLYQSIVEYYSSNTWAWIALASFILMLGCIAMYIFTRRVIVRKAGFFGAIILLFVTIFLITVAYNSALRVNRNDRAVVMVPTTNLTSAPRSPKDKTEKVVPVHEGTVLRIIDSVATPDDAASHMYYDVKINNTSRAWVKAADVERI